MPNTSPKISKIRTLRRLGDVSLYTAGFFNSSLRDRAVGPDYYVQKFGHPMLRARHLPFAIGIKERNQWVQCMDQAMGEVGVDPQLRERLYDSFMNTADWMRNKNG